MTTDEARAVIARCCGTKTRWDAPAPARRAARDARDDTGEPITAYPCPFGGQRSRRERHWHIGHPPAPASLERIAQAVRWHHQHTTTSESSHR